MTNAMRLVWMDEEMREALGEYAWMNRTSMAAVVRAALEDVRDNPADESVLSEDDAKSTVHLNALVSVDLWEAAKKSAHSVGGSLNALVRRRIRKQLRDEGLIE